MTLSKSLLLLCFFMKIDALVEFSINIANKNRALNFKYITLIFLRVDIDKSIKKSKPI